MSYVSRFDLACTFKQGDEFYEEQYLCTVTKDAEVYEEGGESKVKWTALFNNKEVEYLITKKYEHYGPKISKEKEYFTRDELKEMAEQYRKELK